MIRFFFSVQSDTNSFLRQSNGINAKKNTIMFSGAYSYPSDVNQFTSRLRKKVLLVCHPDWHGIRQATYGQAVTLSLPVLLLATIEEKSKQRSLLKFLLQHGVRLLIINGAPPGTISFGEYLKQMKSKISLVFIWHGQTSLAWEAPTFENLLLGVEKQTISQLAFVKPGLKIMAKSIFKTKSKYEKYVELENWPEKFQNKIATWSRSRADIFTPFSDIDGRIHIGVFGWNVWIKNLANQIPAAACMVSDNVVLHVLKSKSGLPNWDFVKHCDARIIQHDHMKSEYFSTVLSRMDINMYVTISEASPMVPLESVSAGVPCLVGPSAILYNKDPYLRKMLVVSELDRTDRISYQLKQALKNMHKIKVRLPMVLERMYGRAFKLWDAFLKVYNINIRRLQGSNGHISFKPKPAPISSSTTIRATIYKEGEVHNERLVYCYCTYELEGVVSGGAGVLISALVVSHLKAGNNVVLLADLQPEEVLKWEQHTVEKLKSYTGDLVVYALKNVAREGSERDIFLRKSIQWAQGVKVVHEHAQFDVIEFFEYAGAAFEIIYHRNKYLPQHVRIIVRIHGSLMLIDLASELLLHRQKLSLLSNDFRPSKQRMYFMEKFSLQNADLIIAPSEALKTVYLRSYQIKRDNVVIGPPCMQQMLLQLKTNGVENGAQLTSLPPPNFLYYGSLQNVKGVALIVDAFLLLLKTKKYRKTKIIFVGIDRMCQTKDGKCLLKNVPKKFRTNFIFHAKRIERSNLKKYGSLVRAAIFPSMFETFCISAHEIYSLRIPVIVSDIPAFRDYFNSNNALVFRSGSSRDLFEYMRYMLDIKPHEYEKKKSSMSPLMYKNPLDVYAPNVLEGFESNKPDDELAKNLMNM
jgi:glycosyltransferase involved in cell wall biosynthesis